MENRVEHIQAAQLYLQASHLIMSTLPLQEQIQFCYNKVTALLKNEDMSPAKWARIRDLKDEIWGCQIEIQSIRLKANRMVKQARYMRSQIWGRHSTLQETV